jgi:hypothetical protein
MTFCYINDGQSNFEFEYLSEFETKFVYILGYESGPKFVRLMEKTRG